MSPACAASNFSTTKVPESPRALNRGRKFFYPAHACCAFLLHDIQQQRQPLESSTTVRLATPSGKLCPAVPRDAIASSAHITCKAARPRRMNRALTRLANFIPMVVLAGGASGTSTPRQRFRGWDDSKEGRQSADGTFVSRLFRVRVLRYLSI
ncbi:hypothetical protein BDW74DRAFT_176387 [Aspergillus multicolor]|uniref:uncharacterized protein n=1 Tax=Aspergillus multicolor TaxID=41759 RepID=UPI003CCC979F